VTSLRTIFTASRELPHCMLRSFSGAVMMIRCG
jgi:hypothetical protein